MHAISITSVARPATSDGGYEAIIGFGFKGCGGKLILGTEFSPVPAKTAKKMRRLLNAGYSIHVLAIDEATYRTAKPDLLAKLGLVA